MKLGVNTVLFKGVDVKTAMKAIKAAGYDGVELGPWGYFPNSNPLLKNALEARGLSLVAGTVGGNWLWRMLPQDLFARLGEMFAENGR